MSSIVTVGLISVEIFEGKTTAILAIGGPQPTSIDVGAATGRRFFDELTKIRETLLAADAVLRDDQAPSGPVTKSEVRLARLLIELDVHGALDHVDVTQPSVTRACLNCKQQVTLIYDEARGYYRGTCACGAFCTTGTKGWRS